jgi:hypothetical protein
MDTTSKNTRMQQITGARVPHLDIVSGRFSTHTKKRRKKKLLRLEIHQIVGEVPGWQTACFNEECRILANVMYRTI